jgi:hypothetical protein
MASLPASQHPSDAALWLLVKHQVRNLQSADLRQHAGMQGTRRKIRTPQGGMDIILRVSAGAQHSCAEAQVDLGHAAHAPASAASRRSSLGLRLQQQAWDGSSLMGAPSEGETRACCCCCSDECGHTVVE